MKLKTDNRYVDPNSDPQLSLKIERNNACSAKTIQSKKIFCNLLFFDNENRGCMQPFVTLTTLRSVLDYIIRACLWQGRALANIHPISKGQEICLSSCLPLTTLIFFQLFRFPLGPAAKRAFGKFTATYHFTKQTKMRCQGK